MEVMVVDRAGQKTCGSVTRSTRLGSLKMSHELS
jgi:hypothetical protein